MHPTKITVAWGHGMKQFTNDEMGTARKGRSHLCFIANPHYYNEQLLITKVNSTLVHC